MERSNVIVVAVVIAALAFFGLQFFSGGPDETEIVASRGTLGADAADGAAGSGDGAGRGGGAAADARRARLGGFNADARPGAGGGTRPGGASGYGKGAAADVVPGSARAGGGSVGVSGSSAGGSAGGSASILGGAGGGLGPRPQRKDDIVDSLSARPPTKSDLDAPPPVDNGDDIALKVAKTDDISEQAGQAEGEVREADDGEEGIVIPENGRVEFPNAGNASKEGSISFTIKPDWAGADATDNAIVQIREEHAWNNGLEIVKNGEYLRFILRDNTGKEADISYKISDWEPNQERTIEFSWGEGRTEASVDNQIVGRNEYPGELQFSQGTPLIFGADHAGSNYGSARARINQFTVSRVPLFR